MMPMDGVWTLLCFVPWHCLAGVIDAGKIDRRSVGLIEMMALPLLSGMNDI